MYVQLLQLRYPFSRYECGKARKFKDSVSEEIYDNRTMQCNWNQTWTMYDSIDECVWVQCLYPPKVIDYIALISNFIS